MSWKGYLSALLTMQAVWFVLDFVMLLFQGRLPMNPDGLPDFSWHLALNATISFITSTNLQHYGGESTVSYFSAVAVFTFLQFVSAATSLAAGVAVVRGLSTHSAGSLGNFYHDFVKSLTRILIPLSLVVAIIFLFSGMPMTFSGTEQQISLQGDTMHIARGPVASMIPIKELGSNGGGYYGTNDAHPLENPNFFTLGIHHVIVFLLPMAFILFVGKFLHRPKFSRVIFGVMTAGYLLVLLPNLISETSGNPKLEMLGIKASAGNMEGKETRFGPFYSAAYSAQNAIIPAGTVTGMHDSYMPLSAAAIIVGMQVDAFFGGLGTGWINMFMYLIIALFIGTLMIGRSPEIFGRKIGTREIRAAILVNLTLFAVPLFLAAIATSVFMNQGNEALCWLGNSGPHGFTTFLYEYVSATAGNGSEFQGLNGNTPFWNLTTSIAMLLGRYVPIIGGLIIVGGLQQKQYVPPGSGTLKEDFITFGAFLFAVIMILSVLSMFIVLLVGPLTEHLMM